MVLVYFSQVTNPGDAFMIVSSSGLITVNGSLNREIRDSYSLRAAVSTTTFDSHSDLSQTSHCNIKGLSVSEVMRIENMITQVKFY